MAKLDFYYDTQKVNEDIANWRDLEIEVNFEDESGLGVVRSGALEFTGDLADKINTWNANGMFGGAGIFEAPPVRIEACGSKEVVFNGGVNTADCSTLYKCDQVTAPLRESGKIDFLKDRATSFSFAYLASLQTGQAGKISNTDYVPVPYVINTIPDWVNVISGIISLYVMVKELEQAIEKSTAAVAEVTGDLIPTIPPATSITIGQLVADIIKLIAYLIYLAILTIAIIDLTALVFHSLVQRTKIKKGIRVRTLFSRACSYLGMNFTSSILNGTDYGNLVIIPKKTAFVAGYTDNHTFVQTLTGLTFNMKRNSDDATNPNSYGYFEGTFADLIIAMSDVFNAKVTIIKNPTNGISTLHFERVDKFINQAAYTLPNIKFDPHGTNACELAANYYLTYALDSEETNTYDSYDGNNCQHILSPSIILNKQNILLSNLDERRLLFTRAKRKTQNNSIEKVWNVFYTIANATYNVFNLFCTIIIGVTIAPVIAGVNFLLSPFGLAPVVTPSLPPFPSNNIGNRIGMLMLSSDFTSEPKLLIVDSSNKVSSVNELKTSAPYLIDNFHYVNFAIRNKDSNGNNVTPSHNQWFTYTDKEIPFCCGDYIDVLNNNYIKTYDQKVAKVKSLIWNPYKETARITFRVKEQYTNNLKETYLIAKN